MSGMAPSTSRPALEAWATQRLEQLGVDGVFAPYVIGMLSDDAGDEEETRFNVHQERALEFVQDLLAFHRNPSLVPVEGLASDDLTETEATTGVDITSMTAMGAELKVSAPLFLPGGSYNETDEVGNDGLGGTEHDEVEGEEPEPVDVMQDEDTFFWSVAYDLVVHLQLKFPEVDPTRLCDLLKLVELDADKAHAVLKATLERESTGTTQVCRHYLAGDCRRADCMFVHDTHAITCRFWLRGMCLQEDHCVFAHDFAEFYALDLSLKVQRDYDSEDEDDSASSLDFQAEEMFPSLQAPGGNSSNRGSQDSVHGLSMNFARAVSVQSDPPPVPSQYFRRSASTPVSRPLYHKTAESVAGHRWLTTGSAVTAQYKQLREEAYELACARNRCFMGATQAYRNGNKSLAKSLSSQGHDYNDKMKRCHFLAASQIFEARNPKSQLYTDHLMDLHGLHVAEAVEFLAQMLPQLADDGLESIYLVTGSGHHSKGPTGNARLLPAVEQFLTAEGYRFSPVADRRGYVGMLMVDLCW
ncbi:hypothetical protein Poli38472_005615 [Pythium oligandrum]|uniref:Smr domain-containing protein n=1 Tax=Pythium oligandrum TaxID=41045 RepID=A0A8K1CIW3_PYTOL|nr:hypothetical protein Poli38472_005615 [Pythium oligandrum]|eukprot:TMW62997.1 hypothetical protein Poli38472_005615 [Pythium oligandrum]